ncbi:DUF4878 domain-containing protein [bacterium]|nr:DUF4878 domain-containing protein [bacterium]
MFRLKKCVIVLVVLFLSGFVVGCGKEKEKSGRKPAAGKAVKSRERIACEETVKDYLDALAANDYERAVEFIDIEGMLEKREEGTATASGPVDAAEMKKMFRLMMERTGQQHKGKLTYEIFDSRVSDGEASVEVEVYREGKMVDETAYPLTRRGGGWKVSGEAFRASLPPVGTPPPGR